MPGSNPTIAKPKRGVSLYSYSGEYGVTMTMEDMFADMHNMGAEGLEILANTHIDGYPEPTDAWVENWFKLLDKYKIKPVEYGHWVDSRQYQAGARTHNERILRYTPAGYQAGKQAWFHGHANQAGCDR